MNREHEIAWWEKFIDKGEELGYQVSREASSIVDFLKKIRYCNYEWCTETFDEYIEGLVRGFQFNEQEYDECHIRTTHDLHSIAISDAAIEEFLYWVKEETYWKDRINYAYYEAKVFAE